MNGWIKAHRKILDNPIVCKDSDHLATWMYLLLNATHKEHPAVFSGKKIMLQPGQLITGRKAISEKLRVTESKIQRILSAFESEHQIEQQTGNKNRLISILSWNEYQDSEQQDEQEMNNKRTTDEQQMNTNKKLRNKESKNERSKESKKEYTDYVFLTETEHSKLTELLGEEERDRYFLKYASWISGKPQKEQERRSAYLSILNWHRENQKKVVSIPQGGMSSYQKTKSKLQQMQDEAEAREHERFGHHQAYQNPFS